MKNKIAAIRSALSPARMSTYEAARPLTGVEDPSAINLYVWNAQISGAFMAPLHICEVVLRNAIATALESTYGANWAWAPGFEQSLPAPKSGYNARQDLIMARRNVATIGKVIPELKFAFWQRMFTSRHDQRVWVPHMRTIFPGVDPAKSIPDLRKELYAELDHIRIFRNRIAHHEPIFNRNLADDLHRIHKFVEICAPEVANWMLAHQQVNELLKIKP